MFAAVMKFQFRVIKKPGAHFFDMVCSAHVRVTQDMGDGTIGGRDFEIKLRNPKRTWPICTVFTHLVHEESPLLLQAGEKVSTVIVSMQAIDKVTCQKLYAKCVYGKETVKQRHVFKEVISTQASAPGSKSAQVICVDYANFHEVTKQSGSLLMQSWESAAI
jgi:hypothetical protein